mmetsp:Transcript_67601/g.207066  ORF Transcript_67601/g.207066 Transcript_67601/m.207066 type:complete len:207 (-) Transcript_67601:999-1619(-)
MLSSGQPSLFTTRSFSATLPAALRAPSRTKPSIVTSPSSTNTDLFDICTLPLTRCFISSKDMPKEGCNTIRAPILAVMPRNVTSPGGSICTSSPASCSNLALHAYMSASADNAQSGGFFFAASARLFFTHVKHMIRSNCEKPTLSSGPQSLGNSCIMHSRRVGDLNLVLASSAHLGFTNSGTMPPVDAKQRTMELSPKTSTLMFPG